MGERRVVSPKIAVSQALISLVVNGKR